MPRSATEATRFTSTGPHAQAYSSASPTSTSSSVPPRGTTVDYPTSAPPPNETPQQKVARLREAARLAKASSEPPLERWIASGRSVADRLHKGTVIGLISLSMICTGMAAYSLGDMMLYNRRKRREFFQEQQRNYDIALQRAVRAEEEGTLTADLALVLNKERAVRIYEEQQARKGGLWKQAKGWVFGGMAMEESPGGRLGKGGFEAEEIKRIAEGRFEDGGVTMNKLREPGMRETEPEVMVKEAAVARRMGEEARLTGGPLDQMAENVVDDLDRRGRSWWSWATGRAR